MVFTKGVFMKKYFNRKVLIAVVALAAAFGLVTTDQERRIDVIISLLLQGLN